jgi:DNA topoisomerase-1
MASLLIVESPAKCSKIQGFLGPGWKVIATFGHIRALEENIDAIGIDRDFEPKFTFLKTKAKHIQEIKDCAAKATKIFLASDDDREGETISYSIATLLKLPIKTTHRIVFHEITKEAIINALRNPRTIDMNLVNAQQSRAILDMLIGFTISPLLWKFIGSGLSAGRCQTPALRIVVERESEVNKFTVNTVWAIQGTWNLNGTSFDANLVDSLENEESARNYLENLASDEPIGHVKSINLKPTSESAPLPLITSTLQQEASALYKSNPKSTMQTAQRLYEQGYITYIRTDNPTISEGFKEQIINYVKESYGEEYIGSPLIKRKKDINAQEAHEAIRPTNIDLKQLPLDEDWSAIDRKIYSLIWNRSVQSLMSPCKGEVRTVNLRADYDSCEFDWKAVWKRVTFYGWKKVTQEIAKLDDEEVEPTLDSWAFGETLAVNDEVKWSKINGVPKDTKPPPRYTEATLVRELEKRGIGRPSTFASLIATILDKGYTETIDVPAKEVKGMLLSIEPSCEIDVLYVNKKVAQEKHKLVPTQLGTRVLEFCVKEFNNLFAYEFTRQMEGRLDLISDGKEPWKTLIHNTWDSYKDQYNTLKLKTGLETQSTRQKTFANGIKAVQSKKGPVLLIESGSSAIFYGWPKDITFANITEEIANKHVEAVKKEQDSGHLGDYEGVPIHRKSGPFGSYISWNSINIPWVETDTVDSIIEKLKQKNESFVHSIGPFEFRNGAYGIYMFKKTNTKNRQFVGLPKAVDPKTLTLEAATRIYQTGLQMKARQNAYKKNKSQ